MTRTETAGEPSGRSGRLRADAQRNRAAILRATVTALRKNPDASVADIAAEAGVGRMTLYGHFKTRPELIEAALADSLARGDTVLSSVDLSGDAREAFRRLIASSWMLVHDSRALLAAAQKELPPTRIRELHDNAEARLRGVLERGQRDGSLRADLPVTWFLAVTHVVLHAAAEEINAGRLEPDDAADVIDATLQAAFGSIHATS